MINPRIFEFRFLWLNVNRPIHQWNDTSPDHFYKTFLFVSWVILFNLTVFNQSYFKFISSLCDFPVCNIFYIYNNFSYWSLDLDLEFGLELFENLVFEHIRLQLFSDICSPNFAEKIYFSALLSLDKFLAIFKQIHLFSSINL